jgi:hypothetical protein
LYETVLFIFSLLAFLSFPCVTRPAILIYFIAAAPSDKFENLPLQRLLTVLSAPGERFAAHPETTDPAR